VTAASPTSYWSPGTEVVWRYLRPDRASETARPVRVLQDDERALAVWLAPGTTVLRPVLGNGDELRSVPLAERFDLARHGRATRRDTWRGPGIVKVAVPGQPWSVWLFWDDGWAFRGWYVNLEDTHVRSDHQIVTQDHVLDLVVSAERAVSRKDEDELEIAVASGRFSAAEAARFRDDATAAEDVVRRWGSPFCDGWERWRPEPGWPTPQLPDALAASGNR
jgi:hypothetical protein